MGNLLCENSDLEEVPKESFFIHKDHVADVHKCRDVSVIDLLPWKESVDETD